MKEWMGTGKSVDEAVKKGLAALGLERDQVSIHVVEENAPMLLKLLNIPRVKVRVVEKSGRRLDRGGLHERMDSAFSPGNRREERGGGARGGEPRGGRQKNNRGRGFNGARGRDDRSPAPRGDDRSSPPRQGDPSFNSQNVERRPSAPRPDRRPPRPPEPGGGRSESPRARGFSPAPRPPVDPGARRPGVPTETLLSQWKELLGWTDLSWEIQSVNPRRVSVNLKTEMGRRLVSDGGRPLESFEHLFNLIASAGDMEKPYVAFQVDGFRNPDEQKSIDQAHYAAEQVMHSGSFYRLEPMPPHLRRIVHQTLADHPDVETMSEGEGPWRKVVVRPRLKK